jgi:8-oxo-dGTP pyrophosphatase MutT (NUDIX family)
MTNDLAPAASVVILREAPALEVLMIRRNEGASFAGGALVFPGGRVDPNDANPLWRDHAEALDPEIGPSQVAAVREAFEETGILIARTADGRMISGEAARAFSPWRARVEDDDGRFLELIRREKLSLACDRLTLFSHWIPPQGLHKRFDTLFFAARLPEGQEPLPDGDEATDALWLGPKSVLDRRLKGEFKIMFPTARNLDLLTLSADVAHVIALSRARRIEAMTPALEVRDGRKYLTIPDGYGYPVMSELLELSFRG